MHGVAAACGRPCPMELAPFTIRQSGFGHLWRAAARGHEKKTANRSTNKILMTAWKTANYESVSVSHHRIPKQCSEYRTLRNFLPHVHVSSPALISVRIR